MMNWDESANEIKYVLMQEGVDPRKIGDDVWKYQPIYRPAV
jgi:hypothetical protein